MDVRSGVWISLTFSDIPCHSGVLGRCRGGRGLWLLRGAVALVDGVVLRHLESCAVGRGFDLALQVWALVTMVEMCHEGWQGPSVSRVAQGQGERPIG